MNAVQEILDLLAQKEELFAQYEAQTNEMLVCQPEEFAKRLRKRQYMIEQLEGLDDKIASFFPGVGEAVTEQIKQALKLSCDRADLPQELLPLFDASQKICAIAYRVQRAEPMIADRIEAEKDRLTEKIKENNRSVNAKAAKYNVAFSSAKAGGFLRGKA